MGDAAGKSGEEKHGRERRTPELSGKEAGKQ